MHVKCRSLGVDYIVRAFFLYFADVQISSVPDSSEEHAKEIFMIRSHGWWQGTHPLLRIYFGIGIGAVLSACEIKHNCLTSYLFEKKKENQEKEQEYDVCMHVRASVCAGVCVCVCLYSTPWEFLFLIG